MRRAAVRKRTIRLYRLTDDSRRLLAGTIEAASPLELVTKWQAFLATAERGAYVAYYRGETIGYSGHTQNPFTLASRWPPRPRTWRCLTS
jgi:hypothetical protein